MLTASVIRTSIYEGSGFNNELISFGSGDYLNDTVGIGGVATPHVLFGYIDTIGFPDQIPYPASSIAGESPPPIFNTSRPQTDIFQALVCLAKETDLAATKVLGHICFPS
jgi:hypothetical protein